MLLASGGRSPRMLLFNVQDGAPSKHFLAQNVNSVKGEKL